MRNFVGITILMVAALVLCWAIPYLIYESRATQPPVVDMSNAHRITATEFEKK